MLFVLPLHEIGYFHRFDERIEQTMDWGGGGLLLRDMWGGGGGGSKFYLPRYTINRGGGGRFISI